MSFEPVPHDSPDELRIDLTGELPEELAALGEQLSADALALAEAFPAGNSLRYASAEFGILANSATNQASARRSWRAWGSAAAAVLVAIGVWQWAGRATDRPATPVARDLTAPALAPALALPTASAEAMVMPAALFESFSAPAQEALLDLLDDGSLPQESVSI